MYCDNITVILKDVPYSYAMLLMLCELVRVRFLEEDEYLRSFGFVLRMMVSGVIMLKIRNNGVLIWLPVGVLLLLDARRRRRNVMMPVIAAILLPLAFGGAFDLAVARFVEHEPASPKEALSLPFQQTARFVSEYGGEVTEEERAIIDRMLDYDSLQRIYTPELSDPIKNTYHRDATAQDVAQYLKVWAKLAARHPTCCLSATIIQNALLFDVSTYNLAIFTGTGLSTQEEEALDIHRSGTLTRLERMESNLRQAALALPFALQLNTLGFYCAVLLGGCAIACSRKVRGMLTILLPQMLTMAVILCGPCIEHQDRYGFPVIYLMPLALAALSCALRRTQRD